MHEKGGKQHEMPTHHLLEHYLDAYVTAAGIGADKASPLFRTLGGRGRKQPGSARMARQDARRRSTMARCNRLSASFGSSCEFATFPFPTPMFYQDIGSAEGYAGEFIVPPPPDATPAFEHDCLGMARTASRAQGAVENRRELRRRAIDRRGRELFIPSATASGHAIARVSYILISAPLKTHASVWLP